MSVGTGSGLLDHQAMLWPLPARGCLLLSSASAQKPETYFSSEDSSGCVCGSIGVAPYPQLLSLSVARYAKLAASPLLSLDPACSKSAAVSSDAMSRFQHSGRRMKFTVRMTSAFSSAGHSVARRPHVLTGALHAF
jgi:hypothetical protein